MSNNIGIMQGRLLPKFEGRYQAHPVSNWADEFTIANQLGLDCIEFILDFNEAENNPLLSDGGVNKIVTASKESSVAVYTICADYFMIAPIHSNNDSIANQSISILQRLIDYGSKLGVSDIVIPCVELSSLRETQSFNKFISQIKSILPLLESTKINLSLETDLAPRPFANLLDKINSKQVTVNYDIGNSAALGYDVIEELTAYGYQITDVHIKDRELGGGPIILGNGNAKFETFFTKLKSFNYTGPFIMQAYRDDEGVEVFKQQLTWIKPLIDKYINGD